jgi:DNA-binding winged helix-turn-helix (wHTH) protein
MEDDKINKEDHRPWACIRLNSAIVFSPEEAMLKHEITNTCVKLQRPASRCFELLLQRQGTLVSQKELIAYGWGEERSRYLTPNAFYQSIHHLRQSLAQVELTDIIYTVSRQGIGIIIELNIAYESHQESIPPGKKLVARLHKSVFVITTISFIFSLLSIFFIMRTGLFHKESLFEKYQAIDNSPCRIYVSPGEHIVKRIPDLLKKAKLNCTDRDTIFITRPKYSERTSLIHCTAYTQRNHQCKSVIVIEKIL